MSFFRYIAIQLMAYAIDMSLFMMVILIQLCGPVEANIVAKLSAGLFAFFLHRHYTFQAAEDASATGQAIRYFIFLILNVPFASGVFVLFLPWMPSPFVAKLIADLICVGFTYSLCKYLIFKKTHTYNGKPSS